MWKASLPTVLIVENSNGSVYIVESKETESQVDKILKTDKLETQQRRSKLKESCVPSSAPIGQNIKEEEEETVVEFLNYEVFEVVDEFEEVEQQNVNVPFVDTSYQFDEVLSEVKPDIKPVIESSTIEIANVQTFDGHWSDEDKNDVDSDEEYSTTSKQSSRKISGKSKAFESRKHFWTHKLTSLQGKIGCKYCQTVFKTRDELTAHKCKYLKCDPKNFICRICKKELSRKTFSNHLHETLDCKFCGKKFVNPRNMKTHLKIQHDFTEKIIPLRENNVEDIKEVVKQEKIRKPRKKEKLECDLCGKYLASHRSMGFHMGMHTNQTSFMCETCGEKFYTPNGIKNHRCEKKRRRPETDFRTYDHRYCRFCDTHFSSFDENKAHQCVYQHPDDAKSVYCRCCGKTLAKWTFNRHMEIHSGVDWECSVCERQVATERALKVHMTTHSGNKPYKCKLCSESCISKVVLARHMRFHGVTGKVFRCDFCFKELSTETSLKSHIKRLHKETVSCELCKKEFTSREQLKEHLKTAHQPSICLVCNKTFSLPRYLKMHEKLHYVDESPRVQCVVCWKDLGVKNIKSHVFRKHLEQFEAWCQANPTL